MPRIIGHSKNSSYFNRKKTLVAFLIGQSVASAVWGTQETLTAGGTLSISSPLSNSGAPAIICSTTSIPGGGTINIDSNVTRNTDPGSVISLTGASVAGTITINLNSTYSIIAQGDSNAIDSTGAISSLSLNINSTGSITGKIHGSSSTTTADQFVICGGAISGSIDCSTADTNFTIKNTPTVNSINFSSSKTNVLNIGTGTMRTAGGIYANNFTTGGDIANAKTINVYATGSTTGTGYSTDAFKVEHNITGVSQFFANVGTNTKVNNNGKISGVDNTSLLTLYGSPNQSIITVNSGGIVDIPVSCGTSSGITIDFHGGVVDQPITGYSGTDTNTVKVTSTSSTGNTITGVKDIDVNSGVFTVANAITRVSGTFNIEASQSAIIDTGGSVAGSGNMVNVGTLTLKNGGSIAISTQNTHDMTISGGTLSGAGLTNTSSLTMSGGTINAPITNNSPGIITVSGAVAGSGIMTNLNDLEINSGANLSLPINTKAGSTINVNMGGIISSPSSSTANVTSGNNLLTISGGVLNLNSGGNVSESINFGTTIVAGVTTPLGGTINLLGGSITSAVTGTGSDNEIINALADYTSTNALSTVTNIGNFIVNTKNFTVNSVLKGIAHNFATAYGTTTTIKSGGDVSGGGAISNVGMMSVSGGTIGNDSTVGNVVNSGTFEVAGVVNVSGFTNGTMELPAPGPLTAIGTINIVVNSTGFADSTDSSSSVRMPSSIFASSIDNNPPNDVNTPAPMYVSGGAVPGNLTFASSGSNRINITGSDTSNRIETVMLMVKNGTLGLPGSFSIPSDGTICTITPGGSASSTVTATGHLNTLQSILDHLQFTPSFSSPAQYGLASITVVVNDHNSPGGNSSSTSMVNLPTTNFGSLHIKSGNMIAHDVTNWSGSINISGGDLSAFDASSSVIKNYPSQTITVSGTGTIGTSGTFYAINNHGMFNVVEETASINAAAINLYKDSGDAVITSGVMTTAGVINAPIVFKSSSAVLTIGGGTINKNITVDPSMVGGAGIINVTGSFTTSKSINNVNTINVVHQVQDPTGLGVGTGTGNFTINNPITGMGNVFTTDKGTTVTINANKGGSIAGGGSITNSGTIMLTSSAANSAANGLSIINPSAVVIGDSESVSTAVTAATPTSTSATTNTVISGAPTLTSFTTITTLTNPSGTTTTTTVTNITPIGNVFNNGTIHADVGQAYIGDFTNQLRNSTLNISGGTIYAKNVNNTAGNIIISSGDLSSIVSATPHSILTNAVGQTITVSGGSIGDNNPFASIENSGIITASGGTINSNINLDDVSSVVNLSGGSIFGTISTPSSSVTNKGSVNVNTDFTYVGTASELTINNVASINITGASNFVVNNSISGIDTGFTTASGTTTTININGQLSGTGNIINAGTLTIAGGTTAGAIGNNTGGVSPTVTPVGSVTNSGTFNVNASNVYVSNFSNNDANALLNIGGGVVQVGTNTTAGNIQNITGRITISNGDLSSINSSFPATLTNNSSQTVTISGTGTVGSGVALGTITNNGTFNAGGSNIIVGEWDNGDIINRHQGSLVITNGTVKTKDINNNFGTITISGGDLSSDTADTNSITNNAAQTITVSGTGTIGHTNKFASIANSGTVNIGVGGRINGQIYFTDLNGTVNFNGGSLIGEITTTATPYKGIINVNANITCDDNTFTIQNVDAINVNGSNTFTINNSISGVNTAFTTTAGATTIFGKSVNSNTNGQLSGAGYITNAGILTISNGLSGDIIGTSSSSMGNIINSGTFNVNSGNSYVGTFSNTVASGSSATPLLHLIGGVLKTGDITNAAGSITVSGGTLLNVGTTSSTLTNSADQTITVSGVGTIGSTSNPLGLISNYGIFNIETQATINSSGVQLYTGQGTNQNNGVMTTSGTINAPITFESPSAILAISGGAINNPISVDPAIVGGGVINVTGTFTTGGTITGVQTINVTGGAGAGNAVNFIVNNAITGVNTLAAGTGSTININNDKGGSIAGADTGVITNNGTITLTVSHGGSYSANVNNGILMGSSSGGNNPTIFPMGDVTNAGTFNVNVGNSYVGNITNNLANALLNIAGGNIQTKDVNNTNGSITISNGDLSSFTTSTLTNGIGQIITVSGTGTVGANNALGITTSIANKGIFNAGGGNINIGTLTNNAAAANFRLTRGNIKTSGVINNTLGAINISNGDLSSSNTSTLTNSANQTIILSGTGTIGAYGSLGDITNNGTFDIGGSSIVVGAFNNGDYSTANGGPYAGILSITNGIVKTGDITNNNGSVTISGGTILNASATASNLTNSTDQSVSISGSAIIGGTTPISKFGNIINYGIFNVEDSTSIINAATIQLYNDSSGVNSNNGTMTTYGNINTPIIFESNAAILAIGGGVINHPISFDSTVGSSGGVINVIGSFSTGGTITNVKNINVIQQANNITNPSTFTINNVISGASSFAVNAGATAILNSNGQLSGVVNITNAGTLTVSGGTTSGAIGNNTGGSTPIIAPIGYIANTGTVNVNASKSYVGRLTNNNTNASLHISGGMMQVGSFTSLSSNVNINNTKGSITISSGDLSSVATGTHASNLTNGVGQSVTVSSVSLNGVTTFGTIGANGALGTITNNGSFIAGGGNIAVGVFTNGNAANLSPSSLSITNGNVSTGNVSNNLGSITISNGDLSSANSIITNNSGQTITVSGTGTIGAISGTATIVNHGIFNVTGSQAKVTAAAIKLYKDHGDIVTGSGTMTTSGVIAAPITFEDDMAVLAISGGAISGAIGIDAVRYNGSAGTVNILGTFSTSNTVTNIRNINVIKDPHTTTNFGNFSINNVVSGVGVFTADAGTTITLNATGHLSGANCSISNAGTFTVANGISTGAIGNNTGGAHPIITPIASFTNSGIVNVNSSKSYVGSFTNNGANASLYISGGVLQVGSVNSINTNVNINNTKGSITISSGDLSSIGAGVHASNLVNSVGQTVTVSSVTENNVVTKGTIGATGALGNVTNNGAFVASGGNIAVGAFTNGNNANLSPASLSITSGNVTTGNVTNAFGGVTISNGDLSAVNASTITNNSGQIIAVSGTGTIGATSGTATIANHGIFNVANISDGYNVTASAIKLYMDPGDTFVGSGTMTTSGNINAPIIFESALATLTVGGGSINKNITVAPGVSGGTINITGLFTTGGTITNVKNINVNKLTGGSGGSSGSGGTSTGNFNINNVVSGISEFKVNSGTSATLNANGQLVGSGCSINNSGSITIAGGTTDGAIGINNSGWVTPVHVVNNSGTFNVKASNSYVGSFVNNNASALLNIAGGVMQVGSNNAIGSVSNSTGSITISSGDLSSFGAGTYISTLTNGYNQTITVSGTGTIGANGAFGDVTNNGTFNAGGDNITLGNFNNGTVSDVNYVGALSITKGIVVTGNINNNYGNITISNGDLSSNVVNSNAINNTWNQTISISGTGSIGANNAFNAINNGGVINISVANVNVNTITNYSGGIISVGGGGVIANNINLTTAGVINVNNGGAINVPVTFFCDIGGNDDGVLNLSGGLVNGVVSGSAIPKNFGVVNVNGNFVYDGVNTVIKNIATVNVNSGSLNINGVMSGVSTSFNIANSASTIVGSGGNVVNSSTITNSGTLTVNTGGAINVPVVFGANGGVLNLAGGTVNAAIGGDTNSAGKGIINLVQNVTYNDAEQYVSNIESFNVNMGSFNVNNPITKINTAFTTATGTTTNINFNGYLAGKGGIINVGTINLNGGSIGVATVRVNSGVATATITDTIGGITNSGTINVNNNICVSENINNTNGNAATVAGANGTAGLYAVNNASTNNNPTTSTVGTIIVNNGGNIFRTGSAVLQNLGEITVNAGGTINMPINFVSGSSGVLNFSGGSVNGDITGVVGVNATSAGTININNDFIYTGLTNDGHNNSSVISNVNTININNTSTFTVNNSIVGINAGFATATGTTTTINVGNRLVGTGAVTNAGTIELAGGAIGTSVTPFSSLTNTGIIEVGQSTMSGNIYVTTLNNNSAGQLIINANGNVTTNGNAGIINQAGVITTAGTINSSINFASNDSQLNITGGSVIGNITGYNSNATKIVNNNAINIQLTEVTDHFTINGAIDSVNSINVNAGNFIINHPVTQLDKSFTTVYGSSTTINSNGNISGSGAINNVGTMTLSGGTIGVVGTNGSANIPFSNIYNNGVFFVKNSGKIIVSNLINGGGSGGGGANTDAVFNQTSSANVNITITPLAVNIDLSSKTITGSTPGSQSTPENTSLKFSSDNSNAISIAGIDDNGGTVQLIASHGTLTLGSANGLTSVAGNHSNSVFISGTLSNLNAALQGLVFTPDSNYVGLDTLQIITNNNQVPSSNTSASNNGSNSSIQPPSSYTPVFNVNSGSVKSASITNILGSINISSGGDLSSTDYINKCTLTNGTGQTITVSGTGTIGAATTTVLGNQVSYALGTVINNGTINAGGGNVTIGDIINSNNAALNISNGIVTTGLLTNTLGAITVSGGTVKVGGVPGAGSSNITNTSGAITISGGDLSSADYINKSTLINSVGQTITVSGTGTIGAATATVLSNQVSYALGTVINNGTINAGGGNVTIGDIINSNNAALNISNGIVTTGLLTNTLGAITVSGGTVKVGGTPTNGGGNITNTSGVITVSGGDLSSVATGANASTLINAVGQTITVSGATVNGAMVYGTIGANGPLGAITNKGIFNAGGGNITVGGFTNINNASLNISKGIVKTSNITNTSGVVTISGGDLSSVGASGSSALTNASGQTITVFGAGTIGSNQRLGVINNSGIFNVISSAATISTPVKTVGNFTNNSGAVANIGGDIDIGGNTYTFINSGTVNMLTNAALIGNYTISSTGTHIVNIDSDNSPSTLTLSNGSNLTLNSNFTIDIKNLGDVLIPDQGEYTVITGNTNVINLVSTRVNILGSSDLVSYTVAAGANSANGNYTDLVLTAHRQLISNIVESYGNLPAVPAATVLDNLINTGVSGDLRTALVRLDGLATEQEVSDAVTQLLPETNVAAEVSFVAPSMVFGSVGERTDLIARAGINNIQTGYTAGGMQANNNLWFKGLGGSINQQQRMTSAGYIANTAGFAVGLDDQIFEDAWLGLAFSSVGSHVNNKDCSGKKTTVNNRQVTFYASYSPANFYMDGFVAMAFSKYKSTRSITYNGLNQTAIADYNAIQPSAKVATGYIFENNNGFRIIPNLSMQYSTLKQSSYNEIGAGGLSLQQVTSSSLIQLEGGAGVKFSLLHNENDEQIYNPDLHFLVLHDFKSSAQVTTAQFLGGGGNFSVQGIAPEKTTYNVGVGMIFIHKNRFHFTVNYDLRKKNKFIGHTGSLAVKYAF